MDLQGQSLDDRYLIGGLLGEGTDAVIHYAMDRHLRRTVAIKLLRPELHADPTFVTRFEREARNTARLNHPHIVSIYDYGDATGTCYLVMEYVRGGDLRTRLQPGVPLPLDVAVLLAAEVAEALGAAHARGIVHRDIKPANILLTEDGHVKVADFGIAKLLDVLPITTATHLLGTPYYLAPEQANGTAITPATDVYALGVVLYEMLGGRRPFEGESLVQVAMQHLRREPPPLGSLNPAVPPALAKLVARALAKDPAKRFADGAVLAAALRAPLPTLGQGALAARALALPTPGPWIGGATHRVAPSPPDGRGAIVTGAATRADPPPAPCNPATARPAPAHRPSAPAAPRRTAERAPVPADSPRVGLPRVPGPPARWGAARAGLVSGAGSASRRSVGAVWAPQPRPRAKRYPSARDAYTTAALLVIVLWLGGVGVLGTRAVVENLGQGPVTTVHSRTAEPLPSNDLTASAAPTVAPSLIPVLPPAVALDPVAEPEAHPDPAIAVPDPAPASSPAVAAAASVPSAPAPLRPAPPSAPAPVVVAAATAATPAEEVLGARSVAQEPAPPVAEPSAEARVSAPAPAPKPPATPVRPPSVAVSSPRPPHPVLYPAPWPPVPPPGAFPVWGPPPPGPYPPMLGPPFPPPILAPVPPLPPGVQQAAPAYGRAMQYRR